MLTGLSASRPHFRVAPTTVRTFHEGVKVTHLIRWGNPHSPKIVHQRAFSDSSTQENMPLTWYAARKWNRLPTEVNSANKYKMFSIQVKNNALCPYCTTYDEGHFKNAVLQNLYLDVCHPVLIRMITTQR